MRALFAVLVLVAASGCGGDDEKDSAAADPCLEYVDLWVDCTISAGLEPDASLSDPAAYCADNDDETDELWQCLADSVHSQYCTNSNGLTVLQGKFAECRGY